MICVGDLRLYGIKVTGGRDSIFDMSINSDWPPPVRKPVGQFRVRILF